MSSSTDSHTLHKHRRWTERWDQPQGVMSWLPAIHNCWVCRHTNVDSSPDESLLVVHQTGNVKKREYEWDGHMAVVQRDITTTLDVYLQTLKTLRHKQQTHVHFLSLHTDNGCNICTKLWLLRLRILVNLHSMCVCVCQFNQMSPFWDKLRGLFSVFLSFSL